MKRLATRKSLLFVVMALTLVAGFVAGALTRGGTPTHAAGLPYANLQAFTSYMHAHHKAPFDRDNVAYSGSSALGAARNHGKTFTSTPYSGGGSNVKVNQDRNPWPKAELGAAVDPTNGNNYVVMANDFRENFDHQFYHVSTDSGQHWTDDSMTVASDPITGGVPFNFQSDPGVGFDSFGHSYLSTINGNEIFDFDNGYLNLDTQIEAVTGY